MNNRKSQNSILFLTTLGVYLGLVLVGATPQVLAQAATAKQFNVKDEIELADKLDNDPDDCQLLAAKIKDKQSAFSFDERTMLDYADVVGAILKKLRDTDTYSLEMTWESFSGIPISHPSASSNGKPVLLSAEWTRSLESRIRPLGGVFSSAQVNGKSALVFEINSDENQITATSKLSRLSDIDAHKAKIAYDTALDYWRCEVQNHVSKSVLDHTEITWTDNQVFIVTRLPRGSLDSLLASDAK